MRYCRYTELLCQCLTYWDVSSVDTAQSSLTRGAVNWPILLLCADRHHILPSLFFSLNQSSLLRYLPKEVSEYLHAVWTLNRRRNRMLRQALFAVSRQLNKIGIAPVLLKGATALIAQENSGCFDRVMYDLDLYIPEQRSREAYDFLKEHGYTPLYTTQAFWDQHHHEAALRHSEFPVSIELHKHILSAKQFNDAPVSVREGMEKIRIGGAEMLLPNRSFRVLHNFIDHSIHDGFFFQNRIELRRLYESVRLRADRPCEIRWHNVQAYCRKKRIYTAWLTYCLSSRQLFACQLPCPVPRFSYALYKEQQVRLHSWFPLLSFVRYWLQRGVRLPARLVRASWYAVKFEDIFRHL
ncbi:MAG: nucleotidyltransferase family protein [Candidatus Electrothrix sp. GW3-4]|uniref:nucleotidyltransferase family protein n=1 Tax=Candidatus Electrothrix sp. GW3-4 TaxID=3126740 RepID=UPI0030D19D70